MSFAPFLTADDGAESACNYIGLGPSMLIVNDLYTVHTTHYKVLDLNNGHLGNVKFIFYFAYNDFIYSILKDYWMVANLALFMEMNAIHSFSFDERAEDATTAPTGVAKCVVVYTGMIEFFDATRLVTTPDTSDDLYLQDVDSVTNTQIYTYDGDGRVAVDISHGMSSTFFSQEWGYT